ncbi:snare protein SED5/Syntaxin 5 [Lactifluus subvellereus]|nr:snare protein SED5/Syntaxin 5 [Lactifluus subvellereus]
MPVQDRTDEFLACVESIRNRSSLPPRNPDKQRLLDKQARADGKSEFTRMASGIGNDISNTTIKLGKLAQLAKRKTLFDDRPVEISELSFVIKQDIAGINKQIAALQAYVKQRRAQGGSKSAEGKQVEEHSHNVVVLLQNKLAETSMTFKDVLEVRTQNMKESKDRTEQFMYSAAAAANQAPANSILFSSTQRQDPMSDGSSGRSDAKGKGRSTPNNGMLALDLEHAEGGMGAPNGGGSAFQQMQLVEQQDSYIQSRSTAIESIETTIAELGQIFNQLAHMVAEQRETVQRIDADTLDIASNVGGAQRELLKYYASISSNRWLMFKVFGVLIVFVSLSTLKLAFDALKDVRLTAALAVLDFYLSIMIDLSSCG